VHMFYFPIKKKHKYGVRADFRSEINISANECKTWVLCRIKSGKNTRTFGQGHLVICYRAMYDTYFPECTVRESPKSC